MNGTIFDIKEMSIHDGPGVRITVFLKGCPLHCMWCHNPEGLSCKPQLLYKKSICTHCGNCLVPCNHPKCQPFKRCVHACANGCLTISGQSVSSNELAEILKKSYALLQDMNGGITISGGEPMLHHEFVCELTDKLGNIHKAIQTSGYTSAEIYEKVVLKFDYIMQDIKIADTDTHIKYTGVSNEKILKNIDFLKHSGKEFVFRVPLIPNITDTPENLKAISKITEHFPVELLKYNVMAGAKYDMLGKKYQLGDLPNREDDFTRYFENAKIE